MYRLVREPSERQELIEAVMPTKDVEEFEAAMDEYVADHADDLDA